MSKSNTENKTQILQNLEDANKNLKDKLNSGMPLVEAYADYSKIVTDMTSSNIASSASFYCTEPKNSAIDRFMDVVGSTYKSNINPDHENDAHS